MRKDVSKIKLESIVNKHTLASTGLGFIPIPLADIAGLMTIQLNMIRQIAMEFEVPFFKQAVKRVISSLVSGYLINNSLPILASVLKIVPGIGQAVGAVTMPVVCGASTYATGKVFVKHFLSGGTFQTFDPEKERVYFKRMLEEGKAVAAKINKK